MRRIVCCARAATGHAAAAQRDELAPSHGLPSSGPGPYVTTVWREIPVYPRQDIRQRPRHVGARSGHGRLDHHPVQVEPLAFITPTSHRG
jgi:hypothetical protein